MPSLENPDHLFLHDESYNEDKKYIEVTPERGIVEDYAPEERFLTRVSINREQHFSRYGGDQGAYAYRIGETALALSRVLWNCAGDITALAVKFSDYWRRGYNKENNLHSMYTSYLISIHDFRDVLWTYTDTTCELFFSYLACHRHLIALEANPDDENYAKPFGRNRHYEFFNLENHEQQSQFYSFLQTNLTNPPYLSSLQRFYDTGGDDQKSHLFQHELGGKKYQFGFLSKGTLYNLLSTKEGYEAVFAHMEPLFQRITGPELPDCETFLRSVFEIQYWYIHIMPCERGSLAVMNMFRYAMLAYYNRRQPNETLWLPIAPNRVDIYPDLEALFLQETVEEFIAASIRDLYCVDYSVYF